jgi:hypothetical protein
MSIIQKKEKTPMDDQNYKDLAFMARDLYDRAEKMQKLMLAMFLDEFIMLDEKEEQERVQKAIF